MAIDYSLIGSRIKDKRKNAKLTQEQLAEKLCVTVGYVSQCERGISKINLEKLSEISDILNCELSYLVTGTVIENTNYLNTEFFEKYGKLNKIQKKYVIGLIDVMLETYL